MKGFDKLDSIKETNIHKNGRTSRLLVCSVTTWRSCRYA